MQLQLGELRLPVPQLALVEDLTDTWSHAIDRYPEGPAESAVWEQPTVIEHGSLRAAAVCGGRIGRSELWAEFRVSSGSPWAELLLRVDWRETRRVLKLVLAPPAGLRARVDGIPGESLQRAMDGVERPLRDFTLLELAGAGTLGVVCPDVFALDATAQRARLTLLRSPLLAHHDFAPQPRPRAQVADRGVHTFRFAFAAGTTVAALDHRAAQWQRPPLVATATHGMPAWPNGLKF
ncbi:MAG: hypothetical protein IT204_23925 [Fimbriimonadaceae bacterium]|nr:hypothetical protein [Fimbriimonadaceae bacterium]